MTIVGTRPEIIRLSRVISKLDESCEHTLVHTGQNYDYELNEIFFQELGNILFVRVMLFVRQILTLLWLFHYHNPTHT